MDLEVRVAEDEFLGPTQWYWGGNDDGDVKGDSKRDCKGPSPRGRYSETAGLSYLFWRDSAV